jgi:hypothetical protein
MQGMAISGLSVPTLDQKRRLMIDARVKTAFHGRCTWKGKTGVMPVEQMSNINVPFLCGWYSSIMTLEIRLVKTRKNLVGS